MSKPTTVGDKVKLKKDNLTGICKFVGEMKGKNGVYYGIELDKSNKGDSNGTNKSIKYFKCPRNKGIFIKKKAILKTITKNNSNPRVTVGDKVKVIKFGCQGVIRFIGEPAFKPGLWYGIQLEQPKGKHNGTFKGRKYFTCEAKHGTFMQSSGFKVAKNKSKASKNKGNKSPTTKKTKKQTSNALEFAAEIEKLKNLLMIRTKQLNKGLNVLISDNNRDDITNLLKSINTNNDDDNKENTEWNLNINTIETINNNILQLKGQINDLTDNNQILNDNNDDNSGNDVDNDDKNDNNEIEKKLKAEIEKLQVELRQINEYKSQIQTLNDNKMDLLNTQNDLKNDIKLKDDEINQLKNELKDVNNKLVDVSNNVSVSPDVSKNVSVAPTILNPDDKDDKIAELMKEKQQNELAIRSKDDIIKNANKKIEELQKELRTIKEEDEKEIVQMGSVEREKAQKLLAQRVNYQQQNTLDAATKKQTISELLANATDDDARSIISSMGVLEYIFDKKEKRDMYTLGMNNNRVLKRLTNDQRLIFIRLLGLTICDINDKYNVEKCNMCNMGIDDKLFPTFINTLIEQKDHFKIQELWIESNSIGDEGMKKLAELINLSLKSLEVIKLYNNKKSTNTTVCNLILAALEKNTYMQKFTFEWRLTQHRDRCDRASRRNQDAKRKAKWAKKLNK